MNGVIRSVMWQSDPWELIIHEIDCSNPWNPDASKNPQKIFRSARNQWFNFFDGIGRCVGGDPFRNRNIAFDNPSEKKSWSWRMPLKRAKQRERQFRYFALYLIRFAVHLNFLMKSSLKILKYPDKSLESRNFQCTSIEHLRAAKYLSTDSQSIKIWSLSVWKSKQSWKSWKSWRWFSWLRSFS